MWTIPPTFTVPNMEAPMPPGIGAKLQERGWQFANYDPTTGRQILVHYGVNGATRFCTWQEALLLELSEVFLGLEKQ